MKFQSKGLSGESPPERIIGTESECNLQVKPGLKPNVYISNDAIKNAGFMNKGSFLDNGCRLYQDVGGHLEISTAESQGPRQAVAADRAGILALSRIVCASGLEHSGLHRHAGTFKNDKGRTSGFHENYLVSRQTTHNRKLRAFFPSYLASRIYGYNGIIGINGYQLSQKLKDIGGIPISSDMNRRTAAGDKPMILIPDEDDDRDTIGASDLARFEIRFADPGFSPTARYLTFGATSLAIRLGENEDKIDLTELVESSFKRPLEAARSIDTDLSFTRTHETKSGKKITALDFQEILATSAAQLSTSIELPKDEQGVIDLWLQACDDLRASDISKGIYVGLTCLMDFAVRYRYISTRRRPDQIVSSDMETVSLNLILDRILPEAGLKFWNQLPSPYVNLEEVEQLVYEPPNTRAKIRSNFIREMSGEIEKLDWANIKFKNGEVVTLEPDLIL